MNCACHSSGLFGKKVKVKKEINMAEDLKKMYRTIVDDHFSPGMEISFVDGDNRQTLVYEKGFASTVYQARQYITHGHIQVAGKKVDAPSYLVKRAEEDLIDYTPNSPLSKPKETPTKSEA